VSIDAAIADLARDQHGLISVGQALELGADRELLHRRTSAGHLVAVNHHVYRARAMPPTWESRVLAAVLDGGDGALASHLCGGALWDLNGLPRSGRPELSIPRGRKHRPLDARCHQSTDLDRCSSVLRNGIPVTDLSRTLLDLGRYYGFARLNRIVEDARRSHDLELNPLIHTLMDHARQGRHGIRRLRAVIDAHAGRDEITDSEFEMLVISLLAERGIQAPVIHHQIWAGEVLIAEVDLAWPQQRLAVELQGQHHREDRQVWEADQVKAVELDALGWTVLPFTWRTYVDRTEWMLSRIRRALNP
jgi:very-short-patch-repair endonuclease